MQPGRNLIPALALILGLAAAADAAFTDALTPLAQEVSVRKSEVDPTTRSGRKQLRALRRAEKALAGDSFSVGDDLAIAKKCAQRLSGPFRGDAEIDGLLAGALDSLETAATDDRLRLEELGGQPDDKRLWTKLMRALDTFDAKREKAGLASSAKQRAARLRGAWRAVAKGEKQLDLGALPDFSLVDENDTSATAGARVSPRDFAGEISAYYFGHST